MALWKPLLLILPAGVVAGIIAAQLVEPQATVAAPAISTSGQSDWRRSAEAADEDFLAEDARRAARQDRYRPDFDWEEDYQPGEREGIYSYYDDLDRSGIGADEDQMADGSGGYRADPDRAAAESAALAAERTVDAVARAAQDATPPPAATTRSRPEPSPSSAPPPEPRTADGDLPAIW